MLAIAFPSRSPTAQDLGGVILSSLLALGHLSVPGFLYATALVAKAEPVAGVPELVGERRWDPESLRAGTEDRE